MWNPHRAVLFDFFGTLTRAVVRGPGHAQIARALGCHPDAFKRALDETFYDRSIGAYGDPVAGMAAVAHRLGQHPTPQALATACRDRIAVVRADTRLRPDAVPVLRELHRLGFLIALVSDCGPELPAFLPCLPVAPFLDARALSIEVRRHKPDPIMYLTASARLGVKPGDCLYVGDGGSRELTGASAVGMTAVRLAAPDLAGHLTFEYDVGWTGGHITTLTQLVATTRQSPARPPAGVPVER